MNKQNQENPPDCSTGEWLKQLLRIVRFFGFTLP